MLNGTVGITWSGEGRGSLEALLGKFVNWICRGRNSKSRCKGGFCRLELHLAEVGRNNDAEMDSLCSNWSICRMAFSVLAVLQERNYWRLLQPSFINSSLAFFDDLGCDIVVISQNFTSEIWIAPCLCIACSARPAGATVSCLKRPASVAAAILHTRAAVLVPLLA